MTNDTNPKNEQTLASFRQQIDALDDKIIDLLIERIGIVTRVGTFKRQAWPGKCPIRAGREAEMVRRIVNKFRGTAVNPVAAAAIWRILIGSSTCVESPLSLSVYAPTPDDTFYWLAREYFGPTLPVTRQPHIKRVIGDVMDGKTSVGVVPMLQGGSEPWWISLMQKGDNVPKIFARIPFVERDTPGKNAPAALAVACIDPEETGDDLSIVVLDADHNVSQHRLQTALTQAKFPARWIDIGSPNASTRRHVLEIKGFLTPANKAFETVLAELGGSLLNTSYLGAYAAPVILANPN